MTKKYILYSNIICPFGHRARIAFKELDVNFETVEVDLIDIPEWYKKLNPEERVPCLDVDGHILTESMVILEYLNECYPEKNLMPKDPLKRAKIRLAIDHFFNKVALPYFMFCTNSKGENTLAIYKETMEKAFVEFDTILKKQSPTGPYYLGKDFSMADVAIAPFLIRIYATNKHLGHTINAVKRSSRLGEFIEGNISRPSVQETWCGDEKLIHGLKAKYGFEA
ncbi:Glutathione S-transferase omega-1 [Choanephora cucurbitarum]|uniref:Glutathione S-transferase omega-1 n=1 Tax=Choanephora cucurbitarum TaxID=101091 RepID=A0A1C7N940_9FUNG|nr:Glutathione S-transferase omega-1 [Choanephora cucurbitarum]